MKHQHGFDHCGLQLAGILVSGVPHRSHCIVKECVSEDLIDFAQEEIFLQNNRIIDIHGYSIFPTS